MATSKTPMIPKTLRKRLILHPYLHQCLISKFPHRPDAFASRRHLPAEIL